MSFSEDLLSGFALAATIAKDAGADKARPGLAASSIDALTARARELASLPKAQRRARVRALMSPGALPAPALTSAAKNPPPLRALALLSQPLRLRSPEAGSRGACGAGPAAADVINPAGSRGAGPAAADVINPAGSRGACGAGPGTADVINGSDEASLIPRAGYSPEPPLLALLQRIAARSGLRKENAWRA